MQPPQNRPAIRIETPSNTQPFDTIGAVATRRPSAAPDVLRSVPPKLAKMLLPGERVTFGTAVHPIVLALPIAYLIAILVLFATGEPWVQHHPGLTWSGTGPWPKIELGIELALIAASMGLLVKRTFRYLALRVVSTNRRIFAIRGVIIRRITPLGNTALAGSTLSQGVFGRMFGYGSIDLPLAEGTPERFRDMRDALELYREFQAVANGVDGDTWTPAVRQTIIP
jgi:hypothetical protein